MAVLLRRRPALDFADQTLGSWPGQDLCSFPLPTGGQLPVFPCSRGQGLWGRRVGTSGPGSASSRLSGFGCITVFPHVKIGMPILIAEGR